MKRSRDSAEKQMNQEELESALQKVREVAEFGADYWDSLKRIIDRIHAMMKGFKEKGKWPPTRLPGLPPKGITDVRERREG